MFSAASVCLCVCQHDNFRTSKHRMIKRGGRCTVQKSRPSSNLGAHLQKCGVRLRRWEISAGCLVNLYFSYFQLFNKCSVKQTWVVNNCNSTVINYNPEK